MTFKPNYLFQKLSDLEKSLPLLSLETKKNEEISQKLKEAQNYLEANRCVDALVILEKLIQELHL